MAKIPSSGKDGTNNRVKNWDAYRDTVARIFSKTYACQRRKTSRLKLRTVKVGAKERTIYG